MPHYQAPLRDYHFCLSELFDYQAHTELPGFGDFSWDVITQVLEEAARFTENVIFPLNAAGDAEGCKLQDGQVTTPAAFPAAYRSLCEGGWPALTCDPEDGGQGMPHMVNFVFEEMMTAACLSFGLFPGLTRGAYVTIARYGTSDQRARHAPKLASGEWTGSMCLTEAHCGTDLGLLRTTATPLGNGRYAITGTKIFISAGEHDLTPNIVYLVLARLPDAPAGTKGISLFLVSKFEVESDGTLGARNKVTCGALEQKMGIHACPTCVMNFDGAVGELVGEPHQGLRAMFSMMNTERIAVGIQGLAAAEASYQNAVAYARERLQGRAPDGPHAPDRPADPIIVHPDVRRMLMSQRAMVEGCRMLALWVARALDVSERAQGRDREVADDFVALMTPVVKALLTDTGSQVANLGMQVFGGHGYIRANGQEQLVRDARITQIYEGTNGIQALDLLGRKIAQQGGKLLKPFMNELTRFVQGHDTAGPLGEFISPLSAAIARLDEVTRTVLARSSHEPGEIGAAAADYLRLFGLSALAYLWARAAEVALPKSNEEFYRAKLATARFFMERLLPETLGLHAALANGGASTMELGEASF